MSVGVRWVVAAAACLSVVVATNAALSQEGEGAPVSHAGLSAQPAPTHEPIVGLSERDLADNRQAPAATLAEMVAARSGDIEDIDAQTECMAKVVLHEAENQPLEGQLAVAEVIVNRMKSGRFGATPCAVANQPGQFFHISSYVAPKSSPHWRTAVAVARVALSAEAPPAAPGALFFHASYAHVDWSHRRVLVGRIGQQVFYR